MCYLLLATLHVAWLAMETEVEAGKVGSKEISQGLGRLGFAATWAGAVDNPHHATIRHEILAVRTGGGKRLQRMRGRAWIGGFLELVHRTLVFARSHGSVGSLGLC